MKCFAVLLSLILAITVGSGCIVLRTEFFRAETRYLYSQGNLAYESGDYAGAERYFKRVVELDRDYSRAYAGLGNISLIRGEFRKAERFYRKAIRLEPKLRNILLPRLAASVQGRVRKPLLECRVSLRKVMDYLSEDKLGQLEKLLLKDVPLELLAKDSVSLTLEELEKLRKMVLKSAREEKGGPEIGLLEGYLLFYWHKHDPLAAKTVSQAAGSLSGERRKEAYMLLGRIYERMDRETKAVNAYLSAEKAGEPFSEIRPLLARIYGVPADEIKEPKSSVTNASDGPSVSATGLSSAAIKPPEKQTE